MAARVVFVDKIGVKPHSLRRSYVEKEDCPNDRMLDSR